MLWDIIRDFFVQYIFGGTLSSGEVIDGAYITFNYDDDVLTSGNISFKFPFDDIAGGYDFIPISIGDWLSTTATIIILCLFILFFIKLTIWFFKQGAGLFKW